MKNPVFTGAGVAIITPMYEDGSINFDELGRIVEDQIARGTDAIVICGTTGECSTMTDEEQLATIKYTVDLVNHRVPVIAGAGSNDTDHGCALAAKSAACGADALLLVTPYYNKTSQAGLVAHFTAMAEAGGIPVILYNVPSRTGLNIAPETVRELSRHPLINGIKEASGNIGQVASTPATMTRWSPCCPWAARASSASSPMSSLSLFTTAARHGSTVIPPRPASCSWRCCPCAMRSSARSTPSRSSTP